MAVEPEPRPGDQRQDFETTSIQIVKPIIKIEAPSETPAEPKEIDPWELHRSFGPFPK